MYIVRVSKFHSCFQVQHSSNASILNLEYQMVIIPDLGLLNFESSYVPRTGCFVPQHPVWVGLSTTSPHPNAYGQRFVAGFPFQSLADVIVLFYRSYETGSKSNPLLTSIHTELSKIVLRIKDTKKNNHLNCGIP